jgi:hypothetical protein
VWFCWRVPWKDKESVLLALVDSEEWWDHCFICKWILVYTVFFWIYLVDWLWCNYPCCKFVIKIPFDQDNEKVKVALKSQKSLSRSWNYWLSLELVDGIMPLLRKVLCSFVERKLVFHVWTKMVLNVIFWTGPLCHLM